MLLFRELEKSSIEDKNYKDQYKLNMTVTLSHLYID